MRLTRLKANLNKTNKYPYLVSNLTNINYLTGFEGSYGNLLIDKEMDYFITDSRYTEYAGSIMPGSVIVIEQKRDFTKTLNDLFKKLKHKKLFIEQSIPYINYLAFKNQLKNIRILTGNDEILSLRIIKDEEELMILRKAVALTDACFSHLLRIIKPGMIEWDIAVEAEYFYRKNGCRKSSFDTIIASGKGSSMPHYITSMTKKIENNDIILIDMGCVFGGYNSDLTRTIFIGNIDPEFRKIYGIIKNAQEEAIHSVKPGITCGKLDKTARDFITKKGYGRAFGHSLGHGIGLEVHESPTIKKQNNFKLGKSTPFTIEPGIYIPDKGGIRIEDVIVTTSNGYENLTASSKDIIIL